MMGGAIVTGIFSSFYVYVYVYFYSSLFFFVLSLFFFSLCWPVTNDKSDKKTRRKKTRTRK